MTGLLFKAAHLLLSVEQVIQHFGPVGAILDMLFGPAEDFVYVSRTTPVDSR